jgi:hypothetical protein
MLLDNAVQNIDQNNWATLESIRALLTAEAIKRMQIARDALIDPSVNNPEESYTQS